MKTIINKLTFCTLILSVLFSCTDIGDDPAFETSASERATAAVKEAQATLTSATEGWIFEYYPDNTQQFGGYNYILTFNANNMVDVYSERQADFSVPETSTYNILSIGGPVLTFDTYNSVMHEFATPNVDEYQAKGGDYEFVISNSDVVDVLNAKGTFTGNNLKLIKLNETPQSYLSKIKATVDYLDGAVYLLTKDGQPTQITAASNNLTFPASEEEGNEDDEEVEDTVIAYIHTTTGIKLYETVSIYGNEVSEFILDRDKKQLISLDGSTILDIVFPPLNVNQDWAIDVLGAGQVSNTFFNTFVEIFNANAATWGETLSTTVYFGNTFSSTPAGILFRSFSDPTTGAGFWAEYNLSFPLLFSDPSLLSITRLSGGFNWGFYGQLDPLVALIVNNAPYIVEGTPTDDPTTVKLTSSTDPEVWFTINR